MVTSNRNDRSTGPEPTGCVRSMNETLMSPPEPAASEPPKLPEYIMVVVGCTSMPTGGSVGVDVKLKRKEARASVARHRAAKAASAHTDFLIILPLLVGGNDPSVLGSWQREDGRAENINSNSTIPEGKHIQTTVMRKSDAAISATSPRFRATGISGLCARTTIGAGPWPTRSCGVWGRWLQVAIRRLFATCTDWRQGLA